MSAYIHGSAPGAPVEAPGSARTFLHRYELVGEVLVRRRVAERRTRSGREVRLVDVLVEEDAAGRSISLVRGILLHEGDLARLDRAPAPVPWREFAVGPELVRAIGEDLGARLRGRPALRLATVDGVRVPDRRRSVDLRPAPS